MQKFILIRGHQGAGKSTFARQQIAAFECDYPHGEVVYIENDRLLTDADGVYRWSPDALEKAQRQGMAQMKAALKRGQAQPQADILIVNANTNQKAAACHHWLQLARKHGFATEIYRLHNFYPNLHGVAEADVLAAYLKLNHNRLRDEIHLEPERPISAEQTAQLARMESFGQQRAEVAPGHGIHGGQGVVHLGLAGRLPLTPGGDAAHHQERGTAHRAIRHQVVGQHQPRHQGHSQRRQKTDPPGGTEQQRE